MNRCSFLKHALKRVHTGERLEAKGLYFTAERHACIRCGMSKFLTWRRWPLDRDHNADSA